MSITLQWQRKTGGTGANIGSPVPLGMDGLLSAPASWSSRVEGPLNVVSCDIFRFEDDPSSETAYQAARESVAAYAAQLAEDLVFRPPAPKPLARGRAVLPNVNDNFGLLSVVTPSASDLLVNCACTGIEVVDDPGLHALTLRVTFAALGEWAAP